jgi:hypothetical protein
MEGVTDLVVAVLMFGVLPLTGIFSILWFKAQKLKQSKFSDKDRQLISKVLQENEELRKRVENIETIASDSDIDLLKLNPQVRSRLDEELLKMKELANREKLT